MSQPGSPVGPKDVTLTPKPLSFGTRVISLIPRIGSITAQSKPYTQYWSDNNVEAMQADGKLLVVLGDSAALSVGATEPAKGYVGLIAEHLSGWRVINLSRSGAKVQDTIDDFLPVYAKLKPDLTVCSIGSNDIFFSPAARSLQPKLRTVVEALRPPAIVAKTAGASPRSFMANKTLGNAAQERGLSFVNPWGWPGEGLNKVASDKFHPNDQGYEAMAERFIEAIEGLR